MSLMHALTEAIARRRAWPLLAAAAVGVALGLFAAATAHAAPYASATAAREAFQWPVLDVEAAKQRSRVHAWHRCKRMEYAVEAVQLVTCEQWAVLGKKCRRGSLYDTARVRCPVWWRLYHLREGQERHCDAMVESWLYQDAKSPTGWMIDSRLYNMKCVWESQIG